MAAWTYSDWITQATATARLTRLRLHVAEVSDRIGNEGSGDGYSEGSGSLTQYMDRLHTELNRLESMPGVSGTGCTSNIRVVRRGRT